MISGPLVDEYWKAACNEIYKLEKIGDWYVIDMNEKINGIDYKIYSSKV